MRRLCFVADYRSPIARQWIDHFIGIGDDVSVISTYPVEDVASARLAVDTINLGLSRLAPLGLHRLAARRNQPQRPGAPLASGSHLGGAARFGVIAARELAALDVHRQAARARRMIERSRPQLVHAMRIPFEGILASAAGHASPLLVSIWGNDLTLIAPMHRSVARATRSVLRTVAALHCDCRRDQTLALSWGFRADRPSVVLPGAGGVRPQLFHAGAIDARLLLELGLDPSAPCIVNPRGLREYVRNGSFFRSLPAVVARHPRIQVACPGMAGSSFAEAMVRELNLGSTVRLLPTVSPVAMGQLFRLSRVAVSPSVHDGTPNSLLEAMASGCVPVAGDIASVREWITDGHNGLLCDPEDPAALTKAILAALEDDDLRRVARERNFEIIKAKADYGTVMAEASDFYDRVIAEGVPHGR